MLRKNSLKENGPVDNLIVGRNKPAQRQQGGRFPALSNGMPETPVLRLRRGQAYSGLS